MKLSLSRARARARIELGRSARIDDRKREMREEAEYRLAQFFLFFQAFLGSLHDATPFKAQPPPKGKRRRATVRDYHERCKNELDGGRFYGGRYSVKRIHAGLAELGIPCFEILAQGDDLDETLAKAFAKAGVS